MPGRRQQSAAESGDTAALPVMGLTCSWSLETRLTRAAIGWGAKRLFACKPGRLLTGQPTDYWAPTNWLSLDNSDTDFGGVSATLVDVPGATPSQLVLALGKDRNAYLINRNNLGGIAAPVAQANMVSGATNRGTSAVTYHTSQGTYFAFHDDGNAISAYKITAANPPTIVFAWSIGQSGRGSPWVTTTDGTNNVIVWVAGVAQGTSACTRTTGIPAPWCTPAEVLMN